MHNANGGKYFRSQSGNQTRNADARRNFAARTAEIRKSTRKNGRNTKGGRLAALIADCKSGLRRPYILSLPPLRALNYIELDLLTFLQAAESICLDGREMHKYILPILAADETITLGVVKPLYCSCFHGVALFLYSLDMR